LFEREKTGNGKEIKASLFETTAFLMGQHMAYGAITQLPVPPMPARVSAWSVYRIFNTKDKEKVFIGIISEKHWLRFCQVFGWIDWLKDERLQINNLRIENRQWFLPELEKRMASLNKAKIIACCEEATIPFAPIANPEDLFEDVQLNSNNSLLETILPNGRITKLPNTPLLYGNEKAVLKLNPPKIGEHTIEILSHLGMSALEINLLKEKNIITTS